MAAVGLSSYRPRPYESRPFDVAANARRITLSSRPVRPRMNIRGGEALKQRIGSFRRASIYIYKSCQLSATLDVKSASKSDTSSLGKSSYDLGRRTIRPWITTPSRWLNPARVTSSNGTTERGVSVTAGHSADLISVEDTR